ncbi:MAG: hypothetical protein ABFR62_05425 [Bacteroidota bacterium]
MKKSLIIFLLLIGQLLTAQEKGKTTLAPGEFESELIEFFSVKNKFGEKAAMQFIDDFDEYKEANQVLILGILNKMKSAGIKDFEYYDQFLKSAVLIDEFSKGSNQSTYSWLKAYGKHLDEIKGIRADREKFIESNYNVLSASLLNPKGKINWFVSDTLGGLKYDSSELIRYSFSNTDLKCGVGRDSLKIYEVNGAFIPAEQIIQVDEAKIYWNSKYYSRDSLYVSAKNFKINVGENGFTADSVALSSDYFIKKKIIGQLTDRVESGSAEKEVYPIFNSYTTDYYFKDIVKGVDYNGGLMVRGNTFYGVGGEDHSAFLFYKKSNKKAITLSSKGFIFYRDRFVSSQSDVSIALKEDSIYHPEIAFNYDILNEKLIVRKNNNRLSQSSYSNSFNNLDMYLKSFAWKRDSSKLFFTTEDYVDVPFVSNKYYEKEIFKQFQGTNNVNPLIKLRDMYDYYEGMTYFPIELVATYMRMPKKYASHLLMELGALGYVYVETDLDRVRFSEKFLNVVDAHKKKIDYDVITFQTPEGKPTKGTIDLDNGEILILGISRVNLSNEKRVSVFPSDSLTVLQNLYFKFNGNINVGNYEFEGSDYNFNYDDFTVVMNGNQRMSFYVPSWKRNNDGKFYYVKVRNQIDSLKGELFIDDPGNKSGKLRLAQYPIFKNTKDAFVFYDLPEIKDSVYKRDELYVKLDPFELDSLNAISSRMVQFPGVVHANGIFPEFKYDLKVQEDYSLGFIYDTEIEGIELYKQGVFNDEITLNMQGLNGRGRVSYLSSQFESTNVEFYPDSLMCVASGFNVDKIKTEKLSTPTVSADSVYVFWKPNSDSLTISLLDKPFVMYDGILTSTGKLNFSGSKLTGSGNVSFETADINSDYYNFYADYFEGYGLDFNLRENIDSPSEFGVINSYGKVDLANRKGHFLLEENNATVEFISNKYEAYIDNVVWNIDDKTVDLKSTNIEKIPWFVSLDPTQDSLRFQAKIASYSLITNEIKASYLEGIEVADALIYPDSLKLVVMENGWMEGFENAKVKIGVGRNEHVLEKASVVIESSDKFSGSADYFYKDIDGIKHPIHFGQLYVDSQTNTSIGVGELMFEEEFMLNPYFSFNGKVEVSGESNFLKFKGYSGIQNYCDNIETGEVPIYDNVDPKNVRVQIENFEDQSRYSFIYNGIYAVDSSYSAAFLSTDRSLIDVDFISAKGRISYDEPEACYVIGGDTINNIVENEVRFYNDECRLGASGEMKFYNPDQVIDVRAFGNVDYDMNSEEMKAELVLGMNFEFNESIMDAIRRDLELAGSKGVIDKESDLQKMAFSRLLNKPVEEKPEGGLFEFGQKLPKDLQFSILLSDMNFDWDSEQNLFLSEQNISVQNFNGGIINKVFNGRVEINKRRGGDEYTIYIVSQNGKYYYFRYRDNVLDFYTNQKLIMDMFDAIEEEDRSYEVNDIKYRFKKASRLKVKTFQQKYI